MKIDFTSVLNDLAGNPIVDSQTKEPLKLSEVAINTLMAAFPDEQNLSGIKKFERYKLAERVASGVVDCTAEDISLLKELIGKGFGPLIVGRAYELLDPGDK